MLERLPERARPVAIGALAGAALVLFRGVFLLLRRGPSMQLFTLGAQALAAAAVAGGVGGVAYGAVRRPFGRLGRAGFYLTGVTSVVTAFATLGIIAALWSDEPVFHDVTGWLLFLGVGVAIGLFVGHSWSKNASSEGI